MSSFPDKSFPKFDYAQVVRNQANLQEAKKAVFLSNEITLKAPEMKKGEPDVIPDILAPGIPNKNVLPTFSQAEVFKEMGDRLNIAFKDAQQGLINSYLQANMIPINDTKFVAHNPITNQVQIQNLHGEEHVTPNPPPIIVPEKKVDDSGFDWDDDLPLRDIKPTEDPYINLPVKGIEEVIRYLPASLDFARGVPIKEAYNKILNKSRRTKDTTKFERDLLKQLAERLTSFDPVKSDKKVHLGEEFQNIRLGRQIKSESSLRSMGSGIKQGTRNNISFGKYLIDLNQLGAGVLAIQSNSKKAIPYLPKRTISKNFRNAIHSATKGKVADLKYLTPEEEDFFKFLVDKSQVYNHLYFTENEALLPQNGSRLFEEIQVLTGEINVGNDSVKLKNRLGDILTYLYNNTNIPKKVIKYYTRKYLE